MWSRHNELFTNKKRIQKLNENDLSEFTKSINSIKSKKLWPQKYGGECYFLMIYENGIKNSYVIGLEKEYLIVDNFSKMRRRLIPNYGVLTKILERNIK
ncbi:hypothetical protein JSO62_02520 [Riemerella anatipestifer]|uniref:hypothetical protein n=1 Tax=Riemerella anatipestifer TaxID=34085 RepID=UPI0030BC0187